MTVTPSLDSEAEAETCRKHHHLPRRTLAKGTPDVLYLTLSRGAYLLTSSTLQDILECRKMATLVYTLTVVGRRSQTER